MRPFYARAGSAVHVVVVGVHGVVGGVHFYTVDPR